jgi:hypothetical protein
VVGVLLYGASKTGNPLTVRGRNPPNYSILVKMAPDIFRIYKNSNAKNVMF